MKLHIWDEKKLLILGENVLRGVIYADLNFAFVSEFTGKGISEQSTMFGSKKKSVACILWKKKLVLICAY